MIGTVPLFIGPVPFFLCRANAPVISENEIIDMLMYFIETRQVGSEIKNRDFKMQALLRWPDVHTHNMCYCACLRREFTPYSCHLLRQNCLVPVVVSTSKFASLRTLFKI